MSVSWPPFSLENLLARWFTGAGWPEGARYCRCKGRLAYWISIVGNDVRGCVANLVGDWHAFPEGFN